MATDEFAAEGAFEHTHEVGVDTTFPKQEKTLAEETLETGKANFDKLTHDLSELAKDFYLFTLGPVYIATKCSFDILVQFAKDKQLDKLPRVVCYESGQPMFEGIEDWSFFIQGMPKELADSFRMYMLQAVFTNRKEGGYWRIFCEQIKMPTPNKITDLAPVDVYVPSSQRYRLRAMPGLDGKVRFFTTPPEQWVVDEANRFFGGK